MTKADYFSSSQANAKFVLIGMSDGKHMARRAFLAACLLVTARLCVADGFTYQYQVYQGDFDGDGDTDLFVREKPRIVLIDYEIPIPVARPPMVVAFVLLQGANHVLSLQTDLSGLNLANKVPASVVVTAIDVDMDGSVDAVLSGLGPVIGAVDQVVFAGSTPGPRNSPESVLPVVGCD